jgi:hypothetical protein
MLKITTHYNRVTAKHHTLATKSGNQVMTKLAIK